MRRFSKIFKTYRTWRYRRKITRYANRIIKLHSLSPESTLKKLSKLRIRDIDKSGIKWIKLKPKERHIRILSLKVLNEIRDRRSLTKVCKEFGIFPRTVRTHLGTSIYKKKGRWIAKKFDRIQRQLNIYERGRIKSIIVTNSKDASLIGKYYNDVKKALETGNESILKKYKRRYIRDTKGKRHKLETRLEKIREIEEAKEDPEFYQIYKV